MEEENIRAVARGLGGILVLSVYHIDGKSKTEGGVPPKFPCKSVAESCPESKGFKQIGYNPNSSAWPSPHHLGFQPSLFPSLLIPGS